MSYIEKLLEETKRKGLIGAPPSVRIATISHDEWCPKLLGTGDCSCDATVSISEPVLVDELKQKERR